MGKVTMVDGAAIPEKILQQAAADDATQEAEIAEHGPVIETVPAVDPAAVPPIVPAQAVPPVPAPIVPPAPVPIAGHPTQIPGAPAALGSVEDVRAQLALEQQRNRTLQGRIDAQGPQTAELVRELRTQNAELLKRAEAPAAPVVAPYLSQLTPDEQELYRNGELPPEVRMSAGLVDAASNSMRVQNEALARRIDDMERQAVEEQRGSRIAAVMQAVEPLFPGATRLNKDPRFNEWLDAPDPRSSMGSTYGDRGADAFARADVYSIAELMNEYKLAGGLVVDPAVAAQIRPAQTTVTAPIVPPQEVRVRESEMVRFNDDRVRGRCRNQDGSPMAAEKIAEITQIMDLALAEGRVDAGI